MSGSALVSQKADASDSAQRFVVLTSNLLSCYKEFGISPSPTDSIEVQKIVNVSCSLGNSSLTVSSSQQSS